MQPTRVLFALLHIHGALSLSLVYPALYHTCRLYCVFYACVSGGIVCILVLPAKGL